MIIIVTMWLTESRTAANSQLSTEVSQRQQAEAELGALQVSFKCEQGLRADLESVCDSPR